LQAQKLLLAGERLGGKGKGGEEGERRREGGRKLQLREFSVGCGYEEGRRRGRKGKKEGRRRDILSLRREMLYTIQGNTAESPMNSFVMAASKVYFWKLR
jgi:hypothetical protein